MHTDEPLEMLAIDVWDGNESQVQIFRNSSGWQLPILMNGMAAGILTDYNCSWDYFFVVDHNGIITYRGAPQSPDHPALKAAVDEALAAMNATPAGDTPAAGHRLLTGYPNPFNPMTRIPYELGDVKGGDVAVRLEILDLRGRVVRTLVDTRQPAGTRHEAAWDGTSNAGRKLPSGSYISQLTVDGGPPQSRVLTLVK